MFLPSLGCKLVWSYSLFSSVLVMVSLRLFSVSTETGLAHFLVQTVVQTAHRFFYFERIGSIWASWGWVKPG
jgi:hypothetical protein